ncbi:MAG: hypothetical protein E6Q49_06545 [Limnohabitans sp.]|nr:MAG: hypothetical protein E6Q49_06545 [Limnohabitans sp.]
MGNTLPAKIAFFVQWREKKLKIAFFLLHVIKNAGALRRGLAVGRSCFCGRSSVGRRLVGVVVGRRVLPAGVVGVGAASSVGSAALGAGGASVGRLLFVG